MQLSRDRMREYQRARRARFKAGAWPSTPRDAPRPVKPSTPAIGPPRARRPRSAAGLAEALSLAAPVTHFTDQFVASPYGRWMAKTETMLAISPRDTTRRNGVSLRLKNGRVQRERHQSTRHGADENRIGPLQPKVLTALGLRAPGRP